jgi:predicted nucleotidyltransferase
MPKRKPYARIAITLPATDLAAADRLAKALDRSRSWVIAESIRRYTAAEAAPPQSPGLGPYRLEQLKADLSLTPEQRVRAAQRTLLRNKYIGRVAEPESEPAPPDRHRSDIAQVCGQLNGGAASYILVGAAAMQFWGTTRATEDIDILIEPTLDNARRVLQALAGVGYGFAAEHTPEEILRKPVTIIGDSPRVDILTRAWNLLWKDAYPRATTFEIEGVPIPTASLEDLIASKRTGRLQDAADIEVLEEIRRLRAGP